MQEMTSALHVKLSHHKVFKLYAYTQESKTCQYWLYTDNQMIDNGNPSTAYDFIFPLGGVKTAIAAIESSPNCW